MSWIVELFKGHTVATAVLLLSLVAASGLALGSIRVYGVGLGIAGVLFTGLLFGHFRLTFSPPMLELARDFGLMLFVYTIGLQVGPGFVDSLRRQGFALNLMAAAIVLLGAAMAVVIQIFGHVPMPAAAGVLAGATTNTPSLAAVQQALAEVPRLPPDAAKLPGLGYAVAYPGGVIGIILMMLLTRSPFRVSLQREAEALRREQAATAPPVARMHLQVQNPDLEGVAIADMPLREEAGIVISRILHEGQLSVARPDTRLHVGDVILAVGPKDRLEGFGGLVGREVPIDLTAIPSEITTRHLVVTKRDVLGKSVDDLDFLRQHGVAITRINRAGTEFTPGANARLQYGDSVLAVGEPQATDRVAVELGHSPRRLNVPEIIPIFVGLALGVIVGSVPFHVPGTPALVRLGLAGGPLLVAIALSRVGRLGPLIWYLPTSANAVLRELGILLFLAAVGIKAGDSFVRTLVQGDGLAWVGWGAAITLVPLLVVATIGRLILKTNYLTLTGLLAGSMTDPPALAFAGSITGSEAPSVAYATVHPMAMILRVLCAEVVVLVFAR